MIYTESKKLLLIESIIKETNGDILKRVENILSAAPKIRSGKFTDFSNTLSPAELEEFEKNIETGCEQINENDWK